MELIFRNAKVKDRGNLIDIGIKDGKFEQIMTKINVEAKKEINAYGKFASAPFVESQVHLDSALSVGRPRFNESVTLLEAINIWGAYKQTLTKEDIKKNAKKAVEWLVTNGVLRIRAHTDSTEPTLMTMEAILELKEDM